MTDARQAGIIQEINAEYRQVHADLEAENDRSAAILGAAYLNDLLERLLSRSLVDGSTTSARDFHGRIDAALGLGLIPTLIAEDLHIVRQIRNKFAHEWKARTLAEAEAQSLVSKLNLRKAVAPEDLDGYPDIQRRLHRQAIVSLRVELAYAISLEQRPGFASPISSVYKLVLAGRTAAPTFGNVKVT